MKKSFFFLFLFICCSVGYTQKLSKSVPFSSNSPFLEPDPQKLILKVSDSEFLTLAKVKGGLNGASEYVLEKFNFSLNTSYSKEFKVEPDEDIIDFFYNGKHAVLICNIHDFIKKKAILKAHFFDPGTGEKVREKVMAEMPVGDFLEERYKGAVKETFKESIFSYLNQNFIIPFQYRFHLKFSPDNNKLLAYFYDYSQKKLVAHAAMFDLEMNQLHRSMVSIDNNFINYGLFPNNRNEFYILNVDRLGRLVLVQYNMGDGTNKFLDLQYTSSVRESLHLNQLNDDVCYIANTNTKDGELLGIMYTKFNFESNLVEKINFYELSTGLKQTVDAAREVNPHLGSHENWKNYEITHFIMNEYEKIILVLEKRELSGGNFSYSGKTVHDNSHWVQKDGRLNVGGMMMFAFNVNDEIIYENFYLKSQVADVNVGLLSSSVELDNSSEGKLRMVYATSDNSSGVFNTLKYVEWDEYNGTRVKELDLESDDKISLMRSHVMWWDDKLVVVGRKGLIGKKTVMNLYDLK